VLAVLVPAQLMGGELASAMLYTSGPAWVNGREVPKSSTASELPRMTSVVSD
jgi:hypothetical protein